MKKLISALIIVVAMTLTSCATGEKMQKVQLGMSRAEVISILGNPDGAKRSGNFEALSYKNRLMSGWSWDRADYQVILEDGIVREYGPGTVRQKDPNVSTLFIMPL